MKIIKEEGKMKKGVIFGAFAMLMSGMCLTACNSVPGKEINFEKKEYILKVDEEINLSTQFNLVGLSSGAVDLVSCDEGVLIENKDGTFKAVKSGQAIVEARVGSKVLASVKVFVKYKLASPTNFVLSETGTLTWDQGYVVAFGEEVKASSYNFSYKTENGEYKEISLTSNNYTFDQTNHYKVKVQAVSDNKYVENSSYCQEFNVNFGMGEQLENVKLTSSADLTSQEATLSWKMEENVVFDVYIEGFKIFENLHESNFTYDYGKFAGGSDVQVKIYTKDLSGNKETEITTLSLHKLETPTLEYGLISNNREGGLNLGAVDGAKEYKFSANGTETGLKELIMQESQFPYAMENDFDGDVYSVKICAFGDGLTLKSECSTPIKVAKLNYTNVEMELNGQNAILSFPQVDYIKTYKVKYAGITRFIQLTDSYETTINLSSIPQGDYEFEISAIPNMTGSSIAPTVEDIVPYIDTKFICSSKTQKISFKVLSNVGAITHALNAEQQSVLTFPAIDGATDYLVNINNSETDIVKGSAESAQTKYTYTIVDGEVRLIISGLKNTLPLANAYSIRITAVAIEGEKVAAIEKSNTKTLNILSCVSASATQTNGSYEFVSVNGTTTYKYEIFKTDSTFAIASGASADYSRTLIGGNKTIENLEAGYYSIRVLSISQDKNNYLDCNFHDESRYFSANFIVTERLLAPQVAFDSQSNALLISRVENAGEYEIYVDGNLVAEYDLALDNGTLEHLFDDNIFKNAKNYSISVQAKSGSAFDGILYLDAIESGKLTITKVALPYFHIIEEFDQVTKEKKERLLVYSSIDGDQTLSGIQVWRKNGTQLTELQTNGFFCDLDYENEAEFVLQVRLVAKEDAANQYYIDSEIATINLSRVSTPTNVQYYADKISFDIADQDLTKFRVRLGIEYYDRLEQQSRTYYKGFQVDFAGEAPSREFDLQEKIDEFLAEDVAFATAYAQMTSCSVSVYSRQELKTGGGTTYDYKISSLKATPIKITRLPSSTISFNIENNMISWTQGESGSTYDLFINGERKISNFTNATISLFDEVLSLSETELLNGVNVYVQGDNAKHLASNNSNTIFIRKLKAITNITISENLASITLGQPSITKGVNINGSDEASFTAGDSILAIELNSQTELRIVLIGGEDDSNYYLTSNESVFNLISLSNLNVVIENNSGTIQWNDVLGGLNIADNARKVLEYEIVVTDSTGKTYNPIQQTSTSINIDSIQSRLGTLPSGNINISISAFLNNAYTLTGQSYGLYSKTPIAQLATAKLESLSLDSKITYITTPEKDDFVTASEDEIIGNSKVVLTWNNLWNGIDGLEFDIVINSRTTQLQSFIYKKNATGAFEFYANGEVVASTSLYTQLTETLNKFTLEISTYLFTASYSDYNVVIRVKAQGSVDSNSTSIDLERYGMPTMNIDENGNITIVDGQNSGNNYVVELSSYTGYTTTDAPTRKAITLSTKQLKLSDFFGEDWDDFFGVIDLKIIAVDPSDKSIRSQVGKVNGIIKLAGIEEVVFDDSGIVTFKFPGEDKHNEDYLNGELKFFAKVGTQEVDISNIVTKDLGAHSYSTTMLKLIDKLGTSEEYNISFMVKRNGAVNSSYKDTKFKYSALDEYKYAKDKEQVETYLIIPADESTTKRFVISCDGATYQIDFATQDSFLDLVVDGYFNGQTSTFSLIQTDGATSCKAINLDDMFALINSFKTEPETYGKLEFDIFRISRDADAIAIQNNQCKIALEKLSAIAIDESEGVNHLHVENNILAWGWSKTGDADATPNKYMIKFSYSDVNEEEIVFKTLSTTVCNLDLTNIGIGTGVEYLVQVKALSTNGQVLSSNYVGEVKTLQYTTPAMLAIENGMLRFSTEVFKQSAFARSISSIANEILNYNTLENAESKINEVAMTLMSGALTSPCYFTIDLAMQTRLSNARATIQFVKLENSKPTAEIYYINLDMYQLIADFEVSYTNSLNNTQTTNFFTLLSRLRENISATIETTSVLHSTLGTILSANQGIGLEHILLDDLGRSIPAGEYNVSIKQDGGENVDSAFTSPLNVSVVAGPSVELSSESGKFYADITPNTSATIYRMYIKQWRRVGLTVQKGDNNTWKIFYGGNELDDVVSANGNAFRIDLNELEKQLQLNSLTLPKNTTLSVDIVGYYAENATGAMPLSKSAQFSVNYRHLPAGNITFEDGHLWISGINSRHGNVRLVYQMPNSTVSSTEVETHDGNVIVDPTLTGEYSWLVVSLSGGIDRNTVYIESESYYIESLYKLSSPNVTTNQNAINVAIRNVDLSRVDNIGECFIANNLMRDGYQTTDQNGTTIPYYIPISSGIGQYVPGSVLNEEDCASEALANQFYLSLKGTSATLRTTESTRSVVYNGVTIQSTLILSSNSLIFASPQTTINARMLPAIESLRVENGDITWTRPTFDTERNIVFEVTIDYFSTSSADTDKTQKETHKLYTTQTTLAADTILINDKDNFVGYEISIRAMAGTLTSTQTEGSVVTMEGEIYSFANELYYSDNTTRILIGTKAKSARIERSEQVTNFGITDGKISFTSSEIALFKIIGIGNGTETELLGSLTRRSATGGGYLYSFTPRIGSSGGSMTYGINYTIKISGYSNSTIFSKPVYIYDVYALQELSSSNMTVEIGEVDGVATTYLNFEKYFNETRINGDENCYKISINYKLAGQDVANTEITSTQESKAFVLSGDLEEISVQVKGHLTSKKLIHSSSLIYSILKTSTLGTGNEQAYSVSFNNEKQTLDWTWLDARTGSYSYYYYITYIDDSHEIGITTDLSYAPQKMGKIVSVKTSARNLSAFNAGKTTIYSYSEFIEQSLQGDFDLFADGSGTQDDPYIILNQEQFMNIAQRNQSGKMYYFKLGADITFNAQETDAETNAIVVNGMKISSFYGYLDGNNHTISINFNTVQTLSSQIMINVAITSAESMSFSSAMAIFGRVEQSATVANVKLNVAYNYSQGTSAIIASLAVENFGTIYNAQVTNSTFSLGQTWSNLFIGGIIGVNYGTISSCINSAQFACSLPQRQINFGYGAIACANVKQSLSNAQIADSANSGTKSFVFGTGNSIVFGAGISLYNNATISRCANDGNFALSGNYSSASGYIGGVAQYSTGGIIEYCFNNGDIFVNANSTCSLYEAGIVYYLNAGSITSVVSTIKNIDNLISGTVAQRSVSYGTAKSLSASALNEIEIDCGNGKKLVVTIINQTTFKAEFK